MNPNVQILKPHEPIENRYLRKTDIETNKIRNNIRILEIFPERSIVFSTKNNILLII